MDINQLKDYKVEYETTIWDYVSVSALGVVTFFQTPYQQGTSPLVGSGTKTLSDTSMRNAGLLPTGWAFKARSFGFQIANNVVFGDGTSTYLADAMKVLQSSIVTMNKNNLTYDLGRAVSWPGGNQAYASSLYRANGNATINSAAFSVTNGIPTYAGMREFSVDGWLLRGGETFTIDLDVGIVPTAPVILRAVFFGVASKNIV